MERQPITVRLDRDLYEWLRRAAFDRRTSQQNIVEEALEAKRAQETQREAT